ALPFALPLRGGVLARGNVVLADHGRTIAGENLSPPPAAAGAGPYRPRLSRPSVTQALPFDPRAARRAPAAMAVRPGAGPEAALPAVTLRGGGLVWKAARELLSSDRFSPEFVVEAESDGTAALRFGDDVLGRQPTSVLTAAYRVGTGSAGNVGAETLVEVDAPFDGIDRVRNPLPAEGGADPEALETARLNAPAAFRTQERMVTDADHVELAGRHPEVQRAAASRRWTGSWYTVFLTIDRRGGRPIDAAFEAELREFLEPYRLAGNDLEIDAPSLVSLEIALRVCVTPGADRGRVRSALTELFSSGSMADGSRGFFHPDSFSFGQPVYLSRVIAAAMSVPGVDYVSVDRFRRWGEPDRGEIDAGEITLGRLEVARLDSDPSRPENGQITFDLRGEEASGGFCGC
ncbi:MAG: baseplate wedge subunit, partial [Armatimonadetes bacterium]|nr:baseplate wedge subunit [Armatimonadota bacterium]